MFDFLLIDGYNIIHDWKNLSKLAEHSLETARDKLIDIMANYQGFSGIEIIIVFDAHKIRQGRENMINHGKLHVVYTAEFETADSYIEKTTSRLIHKKNIKRFRIAVATSDRMEQVIIMGKGAIRLSARDLLAEVRRTETEIRQTIKQEQPIKNNTLLDNLDP
ncbi:MAG: NYN domain-containing protein, partial [Defluviitaleaceae bacterium]|nr:NYN domain-containing protein [Defluviitaleaceae bacterium]